MKKKKAIVLLSGGLDSTVCCAIANETYQVHLLHVNYGQRTDHREARAFQNIAQYYGISSNQILSVDISYLLNIGGSSLTDKRLSIPETVSTDVPSTYVPFRNANLLAIATSWAEVIGAERIFIGAMEEDSSGYPDCREIFYDAYNRMISVGTKESTHITIETPIIHHTKAEVVNIGQKLQAPLHLTWSCYQSEEKACGVCESCRLRISAFQHAGIADPIPYAIPIRWTNKEK